MSRPSPLFSVGEEVIVCSIHYPRFESVVIRIRWKESGRDVVTGEMNGAGWRYTLGHNPINNLPWTEKTLRKKPRPSTESFDQQTGIAKKVYECVPISEAFDAKRICTELQRCGSAPDIHIVNGCLKALKDAGLLTEAHGLFQRVKVRAESDTIKQVIPPPKEPGEPAEPASRDPLDKLAAAASHLRSLNTVLEGIAIEIEDAALSLEDKNAEGNAEVKKLRQLKELLKTL